MKTIHIVSETKLNDRVRRILRLCRQEVSAGVTVEVITRNKAAVAELFASEGLLAAIAPMRGPLGMSLAPVRTASLINRGDSPARLVIHKAADVSIALNARRLSRNPADVEIRAYFSDLSRADLGPGRERLYGATDRIELASDSLKDRFLSAFPGSDPSKVGAADYSALRAAYRAKEIPAGPLQLLYVGDIDSECGLDVLVQTLGEPSNPDWRLTVAGSGRGRDVMPIVRATRSLGIADRIEWLGNVENTGELYERAAVAVLPAKSGGGNALAAEDALAAGCRVIAASTGCHAEIFASLPGVFLVEPGNPQAMKEALDAVVNKS